MTKNKLFILGQIVNYQCCIKLKNFNLFRHDLKVFDVSSGLARAGLKCAWKRLIIVSLSKIEKEEMDKISCDKIIEILASKKNRKF